MGRTGLVNNINDSSVPLNVPASQHAQYQDARTDTTQRSPVVIKVIDYICAYPAIACQTAMKVVFLDGVLTTGHYVQINKYSTFILYLIIRK